MSDETPSQQTTKAAESSTYTLGNLEPTMSSREVYGLQLSLRIQGSLIVLNRLEKLGEVALAKPSTTALLHCLAILVIVAPNALDNLNEDCRSAPSKERLRDLGPS